MSIISKILAAAVVGWIGCLACQPCHAAPVPMSESRAMAIDLFHHLAPHKTLRAEKAFSRDEQPVLRIFSFEDGGFVILAADDLINPVIGFSVHASTEFMPPSMSAWLEDLTQSLHGRIISERSDLQAQRQWSNLRREGFAHFAGRMQRVGVEPLLDAKWSQGWNHACPNVKTSNGEGWTKPPVGCVAIAMGQVMKKWGHPAFGTGAHSYDPPDPDIPPLFVDFSATRYEWADMLDREPSLPTEKLLYHCGVAAEMDYSLGGSGATYARAHYALNRYFGYRTDKLKNKACHSEYEWTELIRQSLNQHRPIMYAGGPHAFNFDGYRSDNFFHVNWGYDGRFDGYYYLHTLKIMGNDHTIGNHAIFGIRPKEPDFIDTQAPRVVRVLGNHTRPGESMMLLVWLEEASHLETLTAKTTLNGTQHTFEFDGSKGLYADKQFEKVFFYLPAPPQPQEGSVRFITRDILGNQVESDAYPISWKTEAAADLNLPAHLTFKQGYHTSLDLMELTPWGRRVITNGIPLSDLELDWSGDADVDQHLEASVTDLTISLTNRGSWTGEEVISLTLTNRQDGSTMTRDMRVICKPIESPELNLPKSISFLPTESNTIDFSRFVVPTTADLTKLAIAWSGADRIELQQDGWNIGFRNVYQKNCIEDIDFTLTHLETGEMTTRTLRFESLYPVENHLPVFKSLPVTSVTAGEPYVYDIRVEDEENHPLVFAGFQLPDWLSLVDNHDGTARLEGIADPTAYQVDIVLGVADLYDIAEQRFVITVIPKGNQPPEFVTTPPTSLAEPGSLYVYDIQAVDPDGDPIHFSLQSPKTSVAGWLTFQDLGSGRARLSGTPPDSLIGQQVSTLIVAKDPYHQTRQDLYVQVTGEQHELFALFAGEGIWQRDGYMGAWQKLFDQEASRIAAGDLDGDGTTDLAGVWNFTGGVKGIWFRYADGTWSEKILSEVDGLIWLEAADYNQDGRDDLITSWTFGVWWRDAVSGTWNRITEYPAEMLTLGNLSGTISANDLVGWWKIENQPDAVWMRTSQGKWSKILEVEHLQWMTLGNCNPDATDEILASFTAGSQKGVACFDSETNQWTRLHPDAAERIAATDVDGDGLDDLIGVWPDLEGIWMRTSRDEQWKKAADLSADWICADR